MLFKKDLTYSEIGVIMLCTTPFSFKILWSPVVEFYYSKSFGKRKSWIVPTQIIMTVILYYISVTLEAMLVAKEVYLLASVLTGFIFVTTC
jgi:MFS transporter, PAT family, solute carrier family 33 (acetyl-CoA transportor), member 1